MLFIDRLLQPLRPQQKNLGDVFCIAPPDELRIKAQQVTKTFSHKHQPIKALDGVCLDVLDGEFLSIIGPSGAGKTTLLNILAGLDRATEGSVRIFGRDPTTIPHSEIARWRSRTIGYIPQQRVLASALSVFENVELPLFLTGLSKPERRDHVMDTLSLFRIANRARWLPCDLISSEQLKVVVARAIVSDPSLLLCDQIGGNSDWETTKELLGVLKVLSDRWNKTIILTSSDPRASNYTLTTRRLEGGRLLPLQSTTLLKAGA